MAGPDTPIVDGRAFSWQRFCELRRQKVCVSAVASAAADAVRRAGAESLTSFLILVHSINLVLKHALAPVPVAH